MAVCFAVWSTVCHVVLPLSVCVCVNMKQKRLPVQSDVEIEAGVMMKPFCSVCPQAFALFLSRFLFLFVLVLPSPLIVPSFVPLSLARLHQNLFVFCFRTL